MSPPQLSLWCYGVGYMTQVAVGLVSSGTKVFKQWRECIINLLLESMTSTNAAYTQFPSHLH